jgi:hypothetical protein
MDYAPQGTYEDLLMILARAEARRGRILPAKPAFARLAFEPFWNLFGMSVGLGAALAPPDAFFRLQDGIFRRLAGAHGGLPFDPESPGLLQAAEACRAGRGSPALLCLASHPPATEEYLDLNIEMMRHGMLALRRLRGRPCRPRLVNAIDPFALDAQPLYREAVCAGFMGTYHLGFDRIWRLRSPLSRSLLCGRSWQGEFFRLAACLRSGGEAVLMLGGGTPTTSRVHTCSREALRHARGRRPGQALRALPSSVSFDRFLRSGRVGARLRRSAWRMMEAWLIACLTEDGALEESDRGVVGPRAREAFLACAKAFGLPEPAAAEALAGFIEEFGREVPYRERLFRVLQSRVAAEGRPLLLIPLVHQLEPLRLQVGTPALLPETGDVRAFARRFVSVNYA